MAVHSFAEAIGRVVFGRRAGRPVRRGSRLKGTCEQGFWHAFDRTAGGRLMLAAERYDRAGKAKGARNGPLGHVALEVLRALVRRVDYRSGRLDPAITTLMRDVARSRGAVVRALAALRDHGFLAWIRRFEPVADAAGAGPRIRQAANAYRLALPAAARALLGRLAAPAPPPCDAIARHAAHAAETERMIATIPLAELGGRTVGGILGSALDRLARSMIERESPERTGTCHG